MGERPLRSFFDCLGPDWIITEEYEGTPIHYVSAEFPDPYEHIVLALSKTVKSGKRPDGKKCWVTIHYELTIITFEFADEITDPASCHECTEDCPNFRGEECAITDEDIEKEIEEHTSKPEKKIRLFAGDMEIRNVVYEHYCALNIPHNHLERALEITLKTTDPELLETIIEHHDLILDIVAQLY